VSSSSSSSSSSAESSLFITPKEIHTKKQNYAQYSWRSKISSAVCKILKFTVRYYKIKDVKCVQKDNHTWICRIVQLCIFLCDMSPQALFVKCSFTHKPGTQYWFSMIQQRYTYSRYTYLVVVLTIEFHSTFSEVNRRKERLAAGSTLTTKWRHSSSAYCDAATNRSASLTTLPAYILTARPIGVIHRYLLYLGLFGLRDWEPLRRPKVKSLTLKRPNAEYTLGFIHHDTWL